MSAVNLSKFGKPQLRLVQNVAQGWSKNLGDISLPFPWNGRNKSHREYRGVFAICKETEGRLVLFSPLYGSNMLPSLSACP